MSKAKRIGIYGGSFNPIHIGHLTVADEVKRRLSLDEIIFVPAGHPYFKDKAFMVEYRHRANMVRLSTGDVPYFTVSDLESDPTKPSYTVPTLQTIKELNRGSKLFLIVGSDALLQMPKWYQADEIPELATVISVGRPGYSDDSFRESVLKNLKLVSVPLDVKVSSTMVRSQIKSGGSFRYLVTDPVYSYIVAGRLYGYGGK